jgi:crotonobetainyl-CoA:carnitine CoA-transferase CaiB-like acyl-CoA transferase
MMEKWGLGPDHLHDLNPALVILRVTGFGQFGPYAKRRAFGTLAEAMSGFAHQTGQPDGPPTLPPFGLADGVTGLAGTIAVLLALYQRKQNGGRGQVIDVSLLEPLLTLAGSVSERFHAVAITRFPRRGSQLQPSVLMHRRPRVAPVECGSGAPRPRSGAGPGPSDHQGWGRLMQSAARSMP